MGTIFSWLSIIAPMSFACSVTVIVALCMSTRHDPGKVWTDAFCPISRNSCFFHLTYRNFCCHPHFHINQGSLQSRDCFHILTGAEWHTVVYHLHTYDIWVHMAFTQRPYQSDNRVSSLTSTKTKTSREPQCIANQQGNTFLMADSSNFLVKCSGFRSIRTNCLCIIIWGHRVNFVVNCSGAHGLCRYLRSSRMDSFIQWNTSTQPLTVLQYIYITGQGYPMNKFIKIF